MEKIDKGEYILYPPCKHFGYWTVLLTNKNDYLRGLYDSREAAEKACALKPKKLIKIHRKSIKENMGIITLDLIDNFKDDFECSKKRHGKWS